MGKNFFSLCMALVLCLSLLPATALAAAPIGQVIYVGNENVTSGGYWTTDSAGNVTQYNEEGKPSNKYIHYNTATNTLTLHNATMILSRLVDTFISKISLTMLPVPKPHNTACVLSWEEARHWQSRSSGYSSS